MAKLDITRHIPPFGRHYAGARVQQGRSLLDADWNEDARLKAEDLRQTWVELAGAQGSSNAGFAVTGVEAAPSSSLAGQSYDFTLRAGSLFVAGMRLVLDQDENFLAQLDWLRIGEGEDELPGKPPTLDELLPSTIKDALFSYPQLRAMETGTRRDLVYLEAWEQAVTTVEDRELRERGLGGPDSSARIRRMRRVHVEPDLGEDSPAAAFEALQAKIANEGRASLDIETGELRSNASLTVTPVTELGQQPCGPAPQAGYVGHEDRAIRVELRGRDKLIWGFDNAAPLYRVLVGDDRKTLTFLNQPRDLKLQPKAEQIVELIPWSAKLPNDEKLAELSGELVRVAKSYEAGNRRVVLAEPLSQALVDWHNSHDEHWSERDGNQANYLYLRLWDRGGDSEGEILLSTEAGPVALGNTGLQVRLGGSGSPGDYWILAARPATPARVVPWELLSDAEPHGPRRSLAPLATISWELPMRRMSEAEKDSYDADSIHAVPVTPTDYTVWGPVRARVTDGRCRLDPLCVRGCATVLVGDGSTSQGMVNTLQEAVDLISPQSGGRIKLLPGEHVGEVTVSGRKKLTICGCGPESKIVNATFVGEDSDMYNQGSPLLTFKDCQELVVEDLSFESFAAVAIQLENEAGNTNRDVRIENVDFTMTGSHTVVGKFALPQAAVLGLGGDGVEISRCRVQVSEVLNYTPALVIGGSRLRIVDNHVEAGELGMSGVESMGGIQILSFSEDVEVARNLIRGGWGHGVALGHLFVFNTNNTLSLDAEASWANFNRTLGDAISNQRNYPIGGEGATALGVNEYWTPGGPLIDVRVNQNRIHGKGLSGVSTGGFVNGDDPVERIRFIVIIDLQIRGNDISGNMQIDGLDDSTLADRDAAVGGVCIAAAINLDIRENRIVDNGIDYETPIVGVGLVACQGVTIQDNFIADNGIAHPSPNMPLSKPGLRGGVAACELSPVRGYTFPDTVTGVTMVLPSFGLRTNRVALTMHKNEVSQRIGKALWVVYGFGPMVVSENSLHGLGDPISGQEIASSELCYDDGFGNSVTHPAQGACVEIRNYGWSPAIDYGVAPPGLPLSDPVAPNIQGGGVDFIANEVRLDWYWEAGYASSVLLSSLDSVTVTNNVMVARMASPYAPDDSGLEDDAEHLDDVAKGSASHSYSYVLVNCWAGATSTVQATGNRFEESRYDCLFSYLGAHAAAFAEKTPSVALTGTTNASLLSMNVGSHCLVPPGTAMTTPTAVNIDNIVIYKSVASCAVEADIDAGPPQQVCIKPTVP